MDKGRGKGNKLRNNEVKIEILYFLASGKQTGAKIRDHLEKRFGLNEPRGIRKHLAELHKQKILDKVDKLGKDTVWWIKENFNVYRNIVLLIDENKHNIDWEPYRFTHLTVYGRKHLDSGLIEWLLKSGLTKRWYKTFNLTPPKKRDFINTKDIILGMNTREILLAMKISPLVLFTLLNPKRISFEPIVGIGYNEFKNHIMTLLIEDALINRPPTLSLSISKNFIELAKTKKGSKQGLLLECEYEVFPNISQDKGRYK